MSRKALIRKGQTFMSDVFPIQSPANPACTPHDWSPKASQRTRAYMSVPVDAWCHTGATPAKHETHGLDAGLPSESKLVKLCGVHVGMSLRVIL